MSTTVLEGGLSGGGLRVAVAAARFNREVTGNLVDGATSRLREAGAEVEVAWCPGAVELPLTAQALAATGRYRAIVAIGCVIRGGTPHFDYVCEIAADGLTRVSLDTGLPVAFGVLTCDDEAQAAARSAPLADGSAEAVKRGEADTSNKGVEAAEAVLEMVGLLDAIGALD